MLKSQKLALRASEIRTKLAELAGKEGELGEEERSEISKFRTEYTDVETRYQAAVTSEDVRETETTDTPEGREYRALVDTAKLGEIYASVIEHRSTAGAEAELQEHHKIGPNQIPLDLLRIPVEERAVSPAPTNVGTTEQPVISAVFANSVGAFLGVDQPTVGAGDAVFPVITSRASVKGPFTGSDEAGETTGAFSAELLKPERLQASYFYKRTDAARFGGMSDSLRENLSMALGDKWIQRSSKATKGFCTARTLPTMTRAPRPITMTSFRSSRLPAWTDGMRGVLLTFA